MEKNNILFIPHNAYHTYNMSLIMKELERLGADCSMLNIDVIHHEGVTDKAKELGIKTLKYTPFFIFKHKPSAIVTMNDWGAVTKKNTLIANILGIPTFGIVEGVQDFEDTHLESHSHFKPRFPYARSKFPLLTGEYDRKFIKTPTAHVVGIARIEQLLNTPTSFPEKDKVIINANFSYGKYSNHASSWINTAVEACIELGIDYSISQHIADKTELNGYNVSKKHINEQVAEASLLISRFSTSILEAMALHKPVIYFNNFGEKVDKFLNPRGAFENPTNKENLKIAIQKTLLEKEMYVKRSWDFFNQHVSIDPVKSSSKRTAEFILTHLKKENLSFLQKFQIFEDEVKRRYFY